MNMRKTTLIIICLLASVAGRASTVSYRDSVVKIIRLVNDSWQERHDPLTPAFWNWAAYHVGNMEAYRLTGERRWLDYSQRWAEHNAWSGATEKDPAKWKYKTYGEDQQHVLFADWQICFQTYIDLYNIRRSPRRVSRAKEVMGYVAGSRATDYWWWADALFMAMPVMTKMYRMTGDERYLDKLYACVRHTDSVMLDSATGLYYRDARYVFPAHTTAAGKKDFWARGCGWVLAGLAKVLQDMPSSYIHYAFFVDKYRRLASAVAHCQQNGGYWTRSMLDAAQAPGPETSGTAFFTYGLLWGINHGILSETDYLPVVSRAWTYLSTQALQSDGSVGYVQPIGDRAIPGQTISAASQADFGVGAFLLAACEYVRFLDRTAAVRRVPLTVFNTSGSCQQAVVETDAAAVRRALGIGVGSPFLLRNSAGQEIAGQETFDGHLLIGASVPPHASWTCYAEAGQPRRPRRWTGGAQYRIRKDDMAWENDRCAYRAYGPALQRTGEASYGIDVWVKNTPDLVLGERYANDHRSNVDALPAEKAGRSVEARLFHNEGSFHLDHGNGFDGYAVGPTLGCGTPAIVVVGKTIMPYCYSRYQILDNGPLRFTVRLDYGRNADGVNVGEHRLITLDKGSHFNKITVWYDSLDNATAGAASASLVAGVVINGHGATVTGKDYVLYADPTDRPDVSGSTIFTGALFPGDSVTIGRTPDGRNAVGIISGYHGQPVTYYAGAGWSNYDVPDMTTWKHIAEKFIESRGLTVVLPAATMTPALPASGSKGVSSNLPATKFSSAKGHRKKSSSVQ